MIKIKKLSVVALVLLVVGIVGGLFTYSSVFQQAEVKKEEMIKDKFSAIEISSDNAEIDIMPTKESVAKIELVTRGIKERKINFKTGVKGKTLSIVLEGEKGFRFGFYPQTYHLNVFLPKKQYESMEVENGNGEVQVEQMKIDDVRVTLINGEAELNGLTAERVEVESNNGKIQLNDVVGEIRGSTVNGEIDVATKALDHPLQLESTNGEIRVQTEKEPTNTRFDVSVVNGEINILDKYTGSTTIGKGENVVKLTTVNGEVSVTR